MAIFISPKGKATRGGKDKNGKRKPDIKPVKHVACWTIDFDHSLDGMRFSLFIKLLYIMHATKGHLSKATLPLIGVTTKQMDADAKKIKVDGYLGTIQMYANRYAAATDAVAAATAKNSFIEHLVKFFHFGHSKLSNVMRSVYANCLKFLDVTNTGDQNTNWHDGRTPRQCRALRHRLGLLTEDEHGELGKVTVEPDRFASERAIKASKYAMWRMVRRLRVMAATIADALPKRSDTVDVKRAKKKVEKELRTKMDIYKSAADTYDRFLDDDVRTAGYTDAEQREHEKTLEDARAKNWSDLIEKSDAYELRFNLDNVDFGRPASETDKLRALLAEASVNMHADDDDDEDSSSSDGEEEDSDDESSSSDGEEEDSDDDDDGEGSDVGEEGSDGEDSDEEDDESEESDY